MYAPAWVKTDLVRFPRAQIEKGKNKADRTISPSIPVKMPYTTLVYTVGHYHTMCYSPFGFDDIGKPFTVMQGVLFGMDVSDPMLKIPQSFGEYSFFVKSGRWESRAHRVRKLLAHRARKWWPMLMISKFHGD